MSSIYVILGGSGEYEDWQERQIEAHTTEEGAVSRLRRFALDVATAEASLLVGLPEREDHYRTLTDDDLAAWKVRLADPSLDDFTTPGGLPTDQSYWISKIEVAS